MPEMRSMTASEKEGFGGLRQGSIGEAGGLTVVAGVDDNKDGRIEVLGNDGETLWTLIVNRTMVHTASSIVLKTIHGLSRKL